MNQADETDVTCCQAVHVYVDENRGRSITVVDTPGFHDAARPYGAVLAEITEILAVQHSLGLPLRGMLFFHSVTDVQLTAATRTYLRLLKSLIGEAAMTNLVLVTTMWDKISEDDRGAARRREQTFVDSFWRPMEANGSVLGSFDGSPSSAFALAAQIAVKDPVVLQIQQDIVDGGADVIHSTAGMRLVELLASDKIEYEGRLLDLDDSLNEETTRGGREAARVLRRQMLEVNAVLRGLERSLAHLRARPGPQVASRVDEARQLKGRGNIMNAFAAVLDMPLFVGRLASN
jgi:hypothetical protein